MTSAAMMRFEFAYHEVLVVIFIGGVILEISGLSEEANLPRGEAEPTWFSGGTIPLARAVLIYMVIY